MNDSLTLPVTISSEGFVAMVLNADGSVNSPTNPAALGSVVSVFVNGLAPNPYIGNPAVQFFAQGWTVTNTQQSGPFLWEVSLQMSPALTTNCGCPAGEGPSCAENFSLEYTYGGSGQLPVSSGETTYAVVYVNC